jgi:hypothetical protein
LARKWGYEKKKIPKNEVWPHKKLCVLLRSWKWCAFFWTGIYLCFYLARLLKFWSWLLLDEILSIIAKHIMFLDSVLTHKHGDDICTSLSVVPCFCIIFICSVFFHLCYLNVMKPNTNIISLYQINKKIIRRINILEIYMLFLFLIPFSEGLADAMSGKSYILYH